MIRFLTMICLLLVPLNCWPKTIEKHTPVTDILQTKEGKILIATPKGLNGYWNNQLHDLHNQLLNNGVNARSITKLAQYGSNENILIGTDTNGVYLIDKSLNIQQHLLSGQKITALYTLNEDSILIATNQHLIEANIQANKQRQLFANQFIRDINVHQDHVYLATSKGLWASPVSEYTFTQIIKEEIWSIVPSQAGLIVFSNPYTYLIKAPDSISRLDTSNDPTFKRGTLINDQQFIVLATDKHEVKLRTFPEFNALNHEITKIDQPIIKLFTDLYGHIWIATTRSLEAYPDLFLKNIPNTRHPNSDRLYTSRHIDGRVFLCSTYQVEVLNTNNIKQPLSVIDPLMESNQIFSCFADEANLWVGTTKGLLKVDLDNNEASFFPLNNDARKQPSINTIHQGPTPNTLLLGTNNQGILFIDKTKPGQLLKQFGKNDINALTFLPERDSLIYVEGQSLITESLYEDTTNRFDIKGLHSITLALAVSNNYAYLATKGSGVLKINLETKEIKQYLEKDGLPNNLVTAIAIDQYGTLWTTTRSGLAYLKKGTDFFQPMGDDHFFSPGGLLKSENGDWFASGSDGLIAFNPDTLNKLFSNAKPPQISIDQILKNGEPIDTSSELILGPDETGINITTLISDVLAKNLTIEYQIPRLSNKWITALNNIINLPNHSEAGEFILHLRIHEYPESMIQIPYTVNESQFYSLIVSSLVISLMVVFLYVLYLSKQRKKALLDFANTYDKLSHSLQRSQKDKLDIARTLGEKIYTDVTQIRARIRRLKRMRQDSEVSRLLKELDQLRNYIGVVEEEYYPKDLKNTHLTQALAKYITHYRDSDVKTSINHDVLSEHDQLTELQRLCLYKAFCYLIDRCQQLNTSLYINIETQGDRLVTNAYFDVALLDPTTLDTFKDHLLSIQHSLIGDDHFLSIELVTAPTPQH